MPQLRPGNFSWLVVKVSCGYQAEMAALKLALRLFHLNFDRFEEGVIDLHQLHRFGQRNGAQILNAHLSRLIGQRQWSWGGELIEIRRKGRGGWRQDRRI